jgi:tryptophan-rich sensory protein
LRSARPPATSSVTRADLAALAILLALSLAVAGVSAAVTIKSVGDWYPTLAKPPFNPPNWLFGPVWTLLYIAMAIAAWRIWRLRDRAPVGLALVLYAAQMTLNFAWSLIFFGMHLIGAAMADIAALLALLAATTLAFWKRDRLAGALMTPYLAWVSFAAILNNAIWRLN